MPDDYWREHRDWKRRQPRPEPEPISEPETYLDMLRDELGEQPPTPRNIAAAEARLEAAGRIRRNRRSALWEIVRPGVK